jgi:RNA polymerase sigma-70 factor (ECF subfamily)
LDPTLYAAARRALARYCNGPGFRDVGPEDLVQEAWIRLAQRKRRGLTVSNDVGYLNVVIQRLAITLSRKRARRYQVDNATGDHARDAAREFDPPSGEDSAETALITEEQRRRAEAAFDELGPDDQRILDLHWNECSSREIAGRLGITEGAVRTRIHRAIKRLRKLMDSS